MKTTYYGLLFCLFICSACSDQNTSDHEIKTEDNKSFIAFDDAKEFLPGWSKENTLIFHVNTDPVGLHPVNTKNLSGQVIQKLTHGYLLMVDEKNPHIVPGIVKSMPEVSDNQLEFTYEIRDEVVWDDGSPVTADDIIFTFKANKCKLVDNPHIRVYAANLKTIEADPENLRRFTCIMKREYVENLNFSTTFPIMCRRFHDPQNILAKYSMEQFDDPAFEADAFTDLNEWSIAFNDGKYGTDLQYLYGLGPYKVVSWDRDQTVHLERKSNHWTEKIQPIDEHLSSYPEKIIFKIIRDENAMMLECKSQTIDVSTALPTKVLVELQQDSVFNMNYHSALMESYGMNTIALNTRPDGISHKKIFTDVKVRRAFAYLTPADQIIQVLILGKANRWPSMVCPLKPEFNDELKLIPYDIEQAKQLLDEAGWKDTDADGLRDKMVDGESIPLSVELTFGLSGNLTKDIVAMISESALQAGVKIIPSPVEGSVLQQRGRDHDFDMLLSGWSTSYLQQDYTQLWHSESWAAKGSNWSGFGSAVSDALIDSIKYTLNDSSRHEMSKRFQKMVYDEQPNIFLYSTYRKVIIHKRWGNQVITAESPNVIINNLRLLSSSTGIIALSGN